QTLGGLVHGVAATLPESAKATHVAPSRPRTRLPAGKLTSSGSERRTEAYVTGRRLSGLSSQLYEVEREVSWRTPRQKLASGSNCSTARWRSESLGALPNKRWNCSE